MANFRYQVLDAAGKQSSGVLEAQSIADASRKLKAEGRYVLKVELDKGPGLMNLELGSKKLNTKELVLISRQLSSLLSAGITIVRSLDMLYQQMETKRSKKCVGEIYESIQQGKTLSEAFRDQRDVIPSIMVSMIAAGEESGRLDEIMARLAEHFQKESKLKNKISSAMVYPKILAFVTVAITVGLMTFLVPGIAETIIGLGGELPALTKAIMAISNSLVHYWFVYVIVIGSIVFAFKTWKKSDKGALQWSKLMLDMPIVGKATKMTAAARFCRMVSTLLKSGISVLSAIEITSASLDNKILEKKLNDARLEIRKGTTLSKSIKNITEFPPMIYAMTAIGEESGTLVKSFESLEGFYLKSDKVKKKLKAALSYPIFVLCVAIVVLIVIMAFVVPQLTQTFTDMGGELPVITKILIATSQFFQNYWLGIFIGFAIIFIAFKVITHNEQGKLWWSRVSLKLPIFGNIQTLHACEQFADTLSSLMASGILVDRIISASSSSDLTAVFIAYLSNAISSVVLP